MEKNMEVQGKQWGHRVAAVVLGGLMAVILCLLMLFLCSIGIANGWLKGQPLYQYSMVGCVVGCFFGGLFAISRSRTRALLVGLGVGFCFFLFLVVIGQVFYQSIALADGGVGLLLGGLCGGAAAGMIGRTPKKKRRMK